MKSLVVVCFLGSILATFDLAYSASAYWTKGAEIDLLESIGRKNDSGLTEILGPYLKNDAPREKLLRLVRQEEGWGESLRESSVSRLKSDRSDTRDRMLLWAGVLLAFMCQEVGLHRRRARFAQLCAGADRAERGVSA